METYNLLLAPIWNRETPVHMQNPISITSISEVSSHQIFGLSGGGLPSEFPAGTFMHSSPLSIMQA
jgi:hypothetical protein